MAELSKTEIRVLHDVDTDEPFYPVAHEESVIDNNGELVIPKLKEEINDLKVGCDGTVYDSAGEAVRGQIGQLSSDLVYSKIVENIDMYNNITKGKKITQNGSIIDDANFSYTEPITVNKDDVIILDTGGSTNLGIISHYKDGYISPIVYGDVTYATPPNKTTIYTATQDMQVVICFRSQEGYINVGRVVKHIISKDDFTIYVDNVNGNDYNHGDKTTPLKTITKALERGHKNIVVNRGTYNENIYMRNLTDITIIAGEYNSFSYDNPVEPTTVNGVDIADCKNITIKGIKVTPNETKYSFLIQRVINFIAIDCEANGGEKGGFGCFSSDVKLVNCKAHDVGSNVFYNADGYNFHEYGFSELINCIAYNCYDDGISHHDYCYGIINGGEIYNCTHGGGISPTSQTKLEINNLYIHNCKNGFEMSGIHKLFGCVSLNNTNKDVVLFDGAGVTTHATKYDTIHISESATFNDLDN